MQCEQIMQREVESCSPDATVAEAARKMRDNDIGFLPVCDESGRVVGALTDRDIAIRCVAEGLVTAEVRDVMTEHVICCLPSDDIERAEELMEQQRVSRIICCDDDG